MRDIVKAFEEGSEEDNSDCCASRGGHTDIQYILRTRPAIFEVQQDGQLGTKVQIWRSTSPIA
jgi:hypothetical protein